MLNLLIQDVPVVLLEFFCVRVRACNELGLPWSCNKLCSMNQPNSEKQRNGHTGKQSSETEPQVRFQGSDRKFRFK